MTALGIDAGGSATRYVVVDAANTVLASGALAPIDGHLFVPEHRARFEAVAAELAQATAGFAPQSIVAGITGLTGDAPEARQAEAIFATALGATAVRVEDDLWIGYHAAFAPGAGHVVYAGTGSVGLRDYCIYLEGNASTASSAVKGPSSDPLFLQLKEEPSSAYAAWLPENASSRTHNGHRVADGQRAMQLTSDPFLGYTSIDGRDYLVRQLNDHKASLDLDKLSPASRCAYADLCGELLARGHARAGDPLTIAAYLGTSNRFDKAILSFAHAYADQTEQDWKMLGQSLKRSK